MLRPLPFVSLAFALIAATTATAQVCSSATDSFWKNDTLPNVPGSPVGVSIIQGLCENEAAGAVFSLGTGQGPQKLTKAAVGFGHASGSGGFNAVVNLEIYDGVAWNGSVPVLGPKVFDFAVDLAANIQVSSHAINEVDLTPYDIVVGNDPSKSFVIAWRMLINPNGACATGFPANFFTDNGSVGFPCDTVPQKSLIDITGQGWRDAAFATVSGVPLCPFFFDGNWVIRACTTDAGPPPTCQFNVGLQGPGTVDLTICGGDLAPGNPADLRIENAEANAQLFFFGSLTLNPFFLFDTFGVMGPNPPQFLAILPADGNGELFIQNAVPGGNGFPLSYYVQVVATDSAQIQGYGHSNTLRIDFQ
ncbi:MAG: hypothetical protein ACF8XB_02705 [Planctomycetota bacterium JB042]